MTSGPLDPARTVSARRTRRRRSATIVTTVVVSSIMAGCASGGTRVPDVATEAEWRALAEPRPTPRPGAARVSVAEVQLVGELPWPAGAGTTRALGVEELVTAGLLRREDVHFVERRRFQAAVEAERSGAPRPPGAPRAGISPGAEYVATAVWISVAPERSSIELRLADAATGAITATARVPHTGPLEPVPVARSIVRAVLTALEEIGRRPTWEDPAAQSGGTTNERSVSDDALRRFLLGVAAEARWDWEGARRAYLAATAESGFVEARAALARVARLRLGGTLGES